MADQWALSIGEVSYVALPMYALSGTRNCAVASNDVDSVSLNAAPEAMSAAISLAMWRQSIINRSTFTPGGLAHSGHWSGPSTNATRHLSSSSVIVSGARVASID